MNQDNKNRIVKGLQVLVLVVFGLLSIITCVGVWNYCPETWVKWCAGVLLACNGFLVYAASKKMTPEKTEEN